MVNCEECPLRQAYEQSVIAKNLQPESLDYREIVKDLTLMDVIRFERLVFTDEFGGRDVLDVEHCPGPRKSFLRLGRNMCTASLAYVEEDRS